MAFFKTFFIASTNLEHSNSVKLDDSLLGFIDDKYNVYCLEPQDDKINLCKDLPNYILYRIII